MKETKLKPFDLTKALAGEKVVTRDGREVTQLVKFEGIDLEEDSLYGVVDNCVHAWKVNGLYHSDNFRDDKDLFMAPKVVKYYVHVFKIGQMLNCTAPMLKTWAKHLSEIGSLIDLEFVKTFELELPE